MNNDAQIPAPPNEALEQPAQAVPPITHGARFFERLDWLGFWITTVLHGHG